MAHPRVWALAMQLAGGDAKRVTVVSAGRVEVIVNEDEPKPVRVLSPVTIPEPVPAPKPVPVRKPKKQAVAKTEPVFTDAPA